MLTRSSVLTLPKLDGRTVEAKALAELRRALQARLGANPSLEAVEVGQQILRGKHDVLMLERRRAETGALSDHEREMQIRREGLLSRQLDRFTALTPKRELTLAEILSASAAGRQVAA